MTDKNLIHSLINDSRTQWKSIINLQTQLLATQSFQFTLMATLRETMPPLHSSIIEILEEYSLKLEQTGSVSEQSLKSPRKQDSIHQIQDYIRMLVEAEKEHLQSIMETLMKRESGREPPEDGDIFQ